MGAAALGIAPLGAVPSDAAPAAIGVAVEVSVTGVANDSGAGEVDMVAAPSEVKVAGQTVLLPELPEIIGGGVTVAPEIKRGVALASSSTMGGGVKVAVGWLAEVVVGVVVGVRVGVAVAVALATAVLAAVGVRVGVAVGATPASTAMAVTG